MRYPKVLYTIISRYVEIKTITSGENFNEITIIHFIKILIKYCHIIIHVDVKL